MMARSSANHQRMLTAVLAVCFSACMLTVSSSLAVAAPGPGWEVTARPSPTNLPPGGSGTIEINLYNVGALPSSGTVTVTDTLPPGLSATEAGEVLPGGGGIGHSLWHCTGTTVVTCTNDPIELPAIPVGDVDRFDGRIGIAVAVAPGPDRTVTNGVTVAGGGALDTANTTDPITLSSVQASFGVAGFDTWFSNEDGTIDTQAGSHPYEATFSIDLNTNAASMNAGGDARTIDVNLPPGLVGNPQAAPQCTRQQLDTGTCPAASQIGSVHVGLGLNGMGPLGQLFIQFSLYNMVPPPGIPAQFAFTLQGINVFLDSAVRTGGDNGISTRVSNIPQRNLDFSSVTLWGVPADPSHDSQRCQFQGCASTAAPEPLLTLPTSCAEPQTFSMDANTWQETNVMVGASSLSHDSNGRPLGYTGCEHLGFGPSIQATPDTAGADTPAGLTVDVRAPVGGLTEPGGLGTADIQNTTVTLPEGLVINPGQAAGLAACGPAEDGVGTEAPPACPLASKIGTVTIKTPLLNDKLEGNVYVLRSNPPNLKLLVAASGDGVNLKLAGDVHLDEATGRLTTTFKGTPELPFTDFKLAFSGGAQAALATPATCGTYSTTSDFTPWSTKFVQDMFPSSSFAITSGPEGSACASPLPFSPSMIAGSTTDQAGGYTSFSLLLQRADGQQRLSTLQFKTPEGLLGMIGKVPLCEEPQAALGTCSAASQIGHTIIEAGPGPYPLVVPQPGQPPAPIYLTGGYKGAPYGLSIVVPLVVGPFTLQTQVVRARIDVDRHTARLTVTTDPLPTIVDGVPADLRTINAVIDRPGFMFNPTNCAPQEFSGIATSAEGANAPLASHFQVGSCQSLSFKPSFKVSTSGKTSRKNGASLDAKIVYPSVPSGNNQASSQSNIASVKVNLPKQLPSRLTTLQKACPVATFEANPAACRKESIVGHATARTPVLPVALTGPAYFVSYAGAAFPQLIVVLQGYGVTVELAGNTFISKAGITSSTFKQVPDVPIASFELKLPQGPFSALAANGNLCKTKLAMPTAFNAQDGAVIHQSTPISVTGCAKAKKKKAKKAGAAAKKAGAA